MKVQTYTTLDDAKRAAIASGVMSGPYAYIYRLEPADLDALRDGGALLIEVGDDQAILHCTQLSADEAEQMPPEAKA